MMLSMLKPQNLTLIRNSKELDVCVERMRTGNKTALRKKKTEENKTNFKGYCITCSKKGSKDANCWTKKKLQSKSLRT